MQYVAIDFETSGLNFWEKEFKVISLSISWFNDQQEIQNYYTANFAEIYAALLRLMELETCIIAHNISFEYAVVTYQFPDVELNWYADTMRLTQVYDNGGNSDDRSARFGLEECIRRVLPSEYHNHKKPYHDWIKENIFEEVKLIKHYKRKPSEELIKKVKVKNPGQYISQLPTEMLETYNRLDTDYTLKLYDTIITYFKQIDYDWTQDHNLYLQACKHLIKAKAIGVKIDTSLLNQSILEINNLIEQTQVTFKNQFPDIIKEIEAEQKNTPFNINSTKQLNTLFVEKLNVKPTLYTPKMFPSFKTKHLSQWGTYATPLMKRGTYNQALAAAETLVKLSEKEGRWHQELKTCGTRTGRYAGGGSLNVQGLSRRFEILMRNFVADKGKVIVSSDVNSAEPTIIAHYSQDPLYKKLTLDMIGQKPYWDSKLDFLISDDIYISIMSKSSIFKDLIKTLINKTPNFFDLWQLDSDRCKKPIKKERAVGKALVLGLGYGMKPRKLQQTAKENGFEISLKDAKEFYNTYWDMFSGVAFFSARCAQQVELDGYILNEFGYRNVPESHKAFNAFIQSTVSGLINLYLSLLIETIPWLEFQTVIHDEIIYQIPEDKIEETRLLQQQATDKLNELLDWSVKMRTGFVVGKNWYEAK